MFVYFAYENRLAPAQASNSLNGSKGLLGLFVFLEYISMATGLEANLKVGDVVDGYYVRGRYTDWARVRVHLFDEHRIFGVFVDEELANKHDLGIKASRDEIIRYRLGDAKRFTFLQGRQVRKCEPMTIKEIFRIKLSE